MLEIRIGSELLEVEKTDLAFDFFVNDFEDVTNLQGSRSYSFTAFDSPKNHRLLGYSNNINSETTLPYSFVSASCTFNGIELDPEAQIYIQGYTKGQGFSLNLLLFKSSLATSICEKTLQDLDLGTSLANNSNQNYSNTSLDYINAFSRLRGEQTDYLFWWQVERHYKLKYLFQQIFFQSGFDIGTLPTAMDWTNDYFLKGYNEYSSVELQHKTYRENAGGAMKRVTDLAGTAILGTTTLLASFDSIVSNTPANFTSSYAILNNIYCYKIKASISFEILINIASFRIELGYATNNADPLGSFVVVSSSVHLVLSGSTLPEGTLETGTTVSGSFINSRIYVRITIDTGSISVSYLTKAGSFLQVEVANYIPESLYTWIHAQDLPKTLQKNVVKSMLLLSNCTLKLDPYTHKIQVISLDTILSSTPADWTSKVDFNSYEVSYIGKFAQNNVTKLKSGDEGSISFAVNNPNLPEKRETAIEFERVQNAPFSETALLDIRKNKAASIIDVSFTDQTETTIDVETQNVWNTLTEYNHKEQKAFIGSLVEPTGTNFVLRLLSNVDRVAGTNPVYAYPIPERVSSSYQLKALQNLQDFEGAGEQLRATFAEKYKKVSINGYISVVDIANLPDVVYLGGDINATFVLISVTNWRGEDELCKIDLLKIQNV